MSKTCIIIPCYNESERLDVASFIDYYERNPNVHLWFVNDGSSDNTLDVIESIHRGRGDRIRFIDQAQNRGKAAAIRIGVIEALNVDSFDIVGYIDADLSTSLAEFNRLIIELSKSGSCQMVFGSRFRRLGSKIERNPVRHILGRVFATMASLVLGLGVYDTQCGAKLFRIELARQIFEMPFMSKWLFDIELFFRTIKVLGIEESRNRLVEIPLNKWIDRGKSRISIMYFVLAPFDLIRITIAYKMK